MEVVRQESVLVLCSGSFAKVLDVVVHDRCTWMSASLMVRALMAAWASSSLSSLTPKTRLNGVVPHAWSAVRQGRMTWVETLPRPSLVEGCMS